MVRLRYVSVWLTLVMTAVLVSPIPTAADALPDETVPQTGRRILLPLVRDTQMPVVLGAYLNPEVSPQYYGTLIDEFEGLVGQEHGIYHYYTHWPLGDFTAGHDVIFGEIAARAATPMLTFMSVPATGNNPSGCGDRDWNLDSIIDGDHDSYLQTFAQQVAQFDHIVLFRWGHEMNLVEYSWSGYCNGRDTGKFITAYRHIVDIFRRQGADNVRWIWSPNYQSWPVEPWNDMHNYYPGDEYVDWIGLVGYNWGASRSDSGYRWATFDYLFGDVLHDMATRYPDKPVMLADYASVEDDGGDKAAWITDAFAQMANHPNLRAVVWHNFDPPWYDDVYFRVDSSSDALDAYQSAVQDDGVTGQAPYQ